MVHTFSSKHNWKTCKDYVCKKLGLPPRAQYGTSVETYVYRRADGTPYLRVQRTEDKQFPQSHWDGQKYVKGRPKGAKIPYRLDELSAASKDIPVFIVEGEKDADRLASLDL